MARPAFKKIHRDDKKKTEEKSDFIQELTLMIREQSQNLAIIPLLLEADVLSSVDNFGNTLLHIAAECNNKMTTQSLIDCGGNIDAQNSLGKTPLMLAVENQCRDSTETLLDANANTLITDAKGKSALHYFLDAQWFRDFLLVRKLLKNVELQCANNCEVIATKLIDAAWPLPCVTLLINDTEVTKVMLKGGCEVDAREPVNDRTALHQAASLGNVELVRLLLAYNADPNALDKFDRTPLSYVYRQKEFTSDERAIQCAEIVKMLIGRGANLYTSYSSSDSSSQINDVLLYGNKEVIEILLQANLNLTKEHKNGDTTVHILARNRNPDVFKALVGRSIDVNAVNLDLETPLCIAASIGNAYTVEFLLERGADVNAVNLAWSSPLYRCIQQFSWNLGPNRPTFDKNVNIIVPKFKTCAQLLLEHRADVQVECNELGKSKTVFDFLHDLESFFIGDLLVAHLVLQEASGKQMNDRLCDRINSRSTLKSDYELYKRQIEIEVYKSVTLLNLLTESDLKFERRLRYKKWVSRLQKYFDECDSKSGYLHGFLQRRFFKTIRIIELRDKAACSFCKIVRIDSLIADNIVGYLREPDLLNFLQVAV